ncbi:hypothetical protein [Desulfotomaculum copahuensis]|nr:hypothetical protein [Desulfotomaculum copahuensis]
MPDDAAKGISLCATGEPPESGLHLHLPGACKPAGEYFRREGALPGEQVE